MQKRFRTPKPRPNSVLNCVPSADTIFCPYSARFSFRMSSGRHASKASPISNPPPAPLQPALARSVPADPPAVPVHRCASPVLRVTVGPALWKPSRSCPIHRHQLRPISSRAMFSGLRSPFHQLGRGRGQKSGWERKHSYLYSYFPKMSLLNPFDFFVFMEIC